MCDQIRVIDLFAGPGGLGEGFSSLRDSNGRRIFQIVMSVEMEKSAHSTLRLRSFYRKIYDVNGCIPQQYLNYMQHPSKANMDALITAFPEEWTAADNEAVQGTLIDGDSTYVCMAQERLQGKSGPVVLIGGPPCQAYSLAGRSRRAHDPSLQDDVKQTLYKCYLQFIQAIQPDVFVMENVKGILSAKLHDEGVLGMIRADIDDEGYDVYSLVAETPKESRDYIVRSEEYGIPQARHRVILLGVRKNSNRIRPQVLIKHLRNSTVRDALAGIPAIRSSFSKRELNQQGPQEWERYIIQAAKRIELEVSDIPLQTALGSLSNENPPSQTEAGHVLNDAVENALTSWYRGPLQQVHSSLLTAHHARSHMASDLDRYLFCSAFAYVEHHSPRLKDFPRQLLPVHRNIANLEDLSSAKFADRFKVQMYDRPSTTVTSHISKDGHYFIHPDYRQCRSLTVREAARLQTFPDDYFFEGNRTDQYRQVGNAVPPLLANQIAVVVAQYLGETGVQDYFGRPTN